MKKITVAELFAGVGGFRLGLEGDEKGLSSSSEYTKPLNSRFKVIWSNQFEPSTKTVQHASEVYLDHWPEDNSKKIKKHSNENIEKVIEDKFKSIPKHDMLVGGFPCQDYSVATTLKNSKGLIGKKGVLWWSIYNILKKKGKNKAKYLLLENVDRLLISPSNQRGRDFAIMLSCLNELGYAVEWRVINAADYGMPQRRRRVFIVGYHYNTKLYKSLKNVNPKKIILNKGIFAESFKIKESDVNLQESIIGEDKQLLSDTFNLGEKKSPFLNSGFMIDGVFYTAKLNAEYNGDEKTLGEILEPIETINKEFYLNPKKLLKNPLIKTQIDGSEKHLRTEREKWDYLKGSKKELKTNKAEGYQYKYSEGAMIFPDDLDNASRTIITGEGGASPSRFKHVVKQGNIERRLTPIELEKLNMFPINHTKNELVTDTKRAFLMGNALVVGVIEKIGITLGKRI